ncbi:MAG: phosphoglycerate kinase [Candidatus Zixiibacteriota bacterium]
MNKKTIDDIHVGGKRVLVRVDFNVPIKNARITDTNRIEASLPTIRKLIADGGRVVLMSHLGRPEGQVIPKFSLKPVAAKLGEFLGKEVAFAGDCVGDAAKTVVDGLHDGEVCLLENLRFHPEEEKNDDGFARQLASLGDVYVNDAFGSAHRAHASTEGVTKYLDTAVAGYLMQKELDALGGLLANPERPFIAVLGGAKVSGKLEVITNLMAKVDAFVIGGGMAFTFLKSQGKNVGKSMVEPDLLDTARNILAEAEKSGKHFLLPDDCLAAPAMDKPDMCKILPTSDIPDDVGGFDIGPKAAKAFAEEIGGAKTIFWNGPMGVFEHPPFDAGTRVVGHAIATATDKGAKSVLGGGDSVAAAQAIGVLERMTHASTGGGASLEFMEGKTLPGVAALNDR